MQQPTLKRSSVLVVGLFAGLRNEVVISVFLTIDGISDGFGTLMRTVMSRFVEQLSGLVQARRTIGLGTGWMSLLLLLAVSTLISGCSPGGGGGSYYAPRVALNPMKIERHAFVHSPLTLTNRHEVPAKVDVDYSDDRYIGGAKYRRFREVAFDGKSYTLAMPLDNSIAVIDSSDRKVVTLRTPRYARYALAVELTHPRSEPFLAVLIEQQATSHSSTLYILDSRLKPVYKEHLLGAIWIAKAPSSDGDILFVSTEDKWLKDGRWATLGGNWRYNVFEALALAEPEQP